MPASAPAKTKDGDFILINFKNNKGITLTTLIITVVVLILIAGTAAYTGIDVYQDAKEEAFIQQLQIVQNAVNNMISKEELHDDLPKANTTSIDLNHPILEEDLSQYTYLSKDALKELGILGVNQEVFVNFQTSKVYSVKGYNEKYTLNDFNMNVVYSTTN